MENNDQDRDAGGSEEDGNHDDYTDGVKRKYKMIDDNDNDGEDLKIVRSSRKKECADESAVPPDESRQPWTG